jgi:peroxiredoxin
MALATMTAMDTLLVAAQLLLAAVFAVAGVAKLLDLNGSRRAVLDFGVPAPAARIIGTALPVAEIATAVGLLFVPTARWAALAALLLLGGFIAGIANAMRKGQAPDCNCFGQLHSAPAGRGTLARNIVLAAVAIFVVAEGPAPAINDWIAARSAAELVAIGLGIALAVLAAVAWRLRTENAELRTRPAHEHDHPKPEDFEREGLPIGDEAPDFELADVRGERHSLSALLGLGRPVVLFFTSPECGPCGGLLPDLARWQETLSDRATVAVVARGTAQDNAEFFAGHNMINLLVDGDSAVFDAYNIRSTPTAVAITPDRRVALAPAGGLHMPEVVMRIMIRPRLQDGSADGQRPLRVLQFGPQAT